MKITCSKRDDILKEREEYNKKKATYDEAAHNADMKRQQDEQAVFSKLQAYLDDNLTKKFPALEFDIDLRRGWTFSRSKESEYDNVDINIRVNDHKMSDPSSALSWDYEVKVDDGEVKKETSSWSGMQAVTKDQLESLRQTLGALEWLSTVDWAPLIKDKLPDSMDYYHDLPDRPEDRDFDKELFEEDIRDSFNTGIGFPGYQMTDNGYRGSQGYYFFYGETPTQYRYIFINAYYIKQILNGDEVDLSWYSPSRGKKSKILSEISSRDEKDRVQVDQLKDK